MYDTQQSVEILTRRANRAIATILGFKERECDQFLDYAISERLRKTVMDQVNELLDLSIDCVRVAAQSEGISNDLYLERLEEIRSLVTNGNGS